MRYPTVAEVLEINDSFVGPGQVRDLGLVEAAVARPRQALSGIGDLYPEVHDKAAALLESLSRNHGFVEGNKRTALAAVLLLYVLNGYWLAPPDEGTLVAFVLDVAEGRLDLAEAAARLKAWAIPAPADTE